jgi:hypothetical protein
VLQTWRNASGSSLQRWSAAQAALAAYCMPKGHDDIVGIFFDWASEHHWHWLHRQRPPGWLPFDEIHWVMPQEAYAHSD